MNKDQFLGRWHEMKGQVKEKWGKLTDDDIAQINGRWEQLLGKLQKRYGWAREQAEREMNHWCASCEQKKENTGYHEKERGRAQHEWHPNEQPEKKHSGKIDEHKEKKRKAG